MASKKRSKPKAVKKPRKPVSETKPRKPVAETKPSDKLKERLARQIARQYPKPVAVAVPKAKPVAKPKPKRPDPAKPFGKKPGFRVILPTKRQREAEKQEIRPRSKYKYELLRLVKGKYVKVPLKKFSPNHTYKIYLIHKKSKDRRLLGFGKFVNIPHVSIMTGKQHSGYAFKPRRGKPPKGWVKTSTIYQAFQDEVAQEADKENLEIRASLVPVRKYYHPKYMIFSDYKINLQDKPKVVGVSVLMKFVYQNSQWINKRVVFIDMRDEFKRRGIRYKDLYLHKEEIEEVINFSARVSFVSVAYRQAKITAMRINGFIPSTFVPKKHVSPFGLTFKSYAT